MSARVPSDSEMESIKARFSEQYPRIRRLASFQHRGLHGDQRDEAIAETIDWTWNAYRRMALAGKDPTPLLAKMVRFAAMQIRADKRMAGSNTTDVMSRANRGRHDYRLTSLPHSDDEEAASEAHDALKARIPNSAEEAILNADYKAFLQTLSEKERDLTESLRSGLNMSDVARRRGVSNAAVQDMRNTVARKWDEYFQEAAERSR